MSSIRAGTLAGQGILVRIDHALAAEALRAPGHRAAVVAIGRAGHGDVAHHVRVAAREQIVDRYVADTESGADFAHQQAADSVRAPECLEAAQPEAAAFILDLPRLLRRIAALGEVGAIDGGGVCRLALSDEDRAGRDLVVSWMRELGLSVSIDGIGNVVGVRAGQEDLPPVMTGSHIDTVRTGGRYDGNLGVLAGLEVMAALDDAGIVTRRPLAVAFFTNEEGARFAPRHDGQPSLPGRSAAAAGPGHARHRRHHGRREPVPYRLRRPRAGGLHPRARLCRTARGTGPGAGA